MMIPAPKFWTDGGTIFKGYKPGSKLYKCPHCNDFVWLYILAEIFQEKKLGDKTYKGAKTPIYVSDEEAVKYVTDNTVERSAELFIREEAWRSDNDKFRELEEKVLAGQFALTPDQQTNMKALLSLLDENNPSQRLIKGEIYRQSSMFNECIELLSKPMESKGYMKAAEHIIGLAKQSKTYVTLIDIDIKQITLDPKPSDKIKIFTPVLPRPVQRNKAN
ncbi:MAG: hypothetical protein KKB51_15675 [Candidatus Riflebacteria bacterium]|nr:hypothetical protein [Candidatus Riflebacteria bacterium]